MFRKDLFTLLLLFIVRDNVLRFDIETPELEENDLKALSIGNLLHQSVRLKNDILCDCLAFLPL